MLDVTEVVVVPPRCVVPVVELGFAVTFGVGVGVALGFTSFLSSPAIVTKAFKAVQEKYASYFETIEYAVFCGGHETQNYDAFCEVFVL